jgi:hypothetical protein
LIKFAKSFRRIFLLIILNYALNLSNFLYISIALVQI